MYLFFFETCCRFYCVVYSLYNMKMHVFISYNEIAIFLANPMKSNILNPPSYQPVFYQFRKQMYHGPIVLIFGVCPYTNQYSVGSTKLAQTYKSNILGPPLYQPVYYQFPQQKYLGTTILTFWAALILTCILLVLPTKIPRTPNFNISHVRIMGPGYCCQRNQ